MATFRMPPLPPRVTAPAPTVDFQSGSEGAGVAFRVTGLAALEQRLLQVPQVFRDSAGYEMANIAAEIIADAVASYVPEDTGALKESGRSDEYIPGSTASITKIAMWFGGNDGGTTGTPAGESKNVIGGVLRSGDFGVMHIADMRKMVKLGQISARLPERYALEQHENRMFNHPRGGGAKYLELPLMAKIPEIVPRLAAAASIDLQAAFPGYTHSPVAVEGP